MRSLVCAIALLAGPTPALAQVASETILRGLVGPVAIVADPTHASTFFIVEQRGLIRVARDGAILEAPLLDLRSEISSGGERGLLGMALAPEYVESRRFFVNFTNRQGHTVIARFTRDRENALRTSAESRFDLQWSDGQRVIVQPFSNHNGGHLAFGPDRYLYVGLGDGGSGGDPQNHAQNPRSLLGKMLRLDVSVPDDHPRGYRIPEDNPFADADPITALSEIWSFGLRNPWRYSFDDWTRGGTGALVLADVGQDAREEINFEPPGRGGRNYGWRLREGRQAYDARTPPAFAPLTEPIHDYSRALGSSVTGGWIYRGQALDPSLHGRYFFADFISGRVFSIGLHLDPLSSEATADDEREHTERLGGRSVVGMVSSFAQDHQGELLLLNFSAGTVVRIAPDLAAVPEAPRVVARTQSDRVRLMWEPAAAGVPPASYAIERLRAGAAVERQFSDGREATLAWQSGDCVQVRATARSGVSGPPSTAVCTP